MIQMTTFVPPEQAEALARDVAGIEGVRHVVVGRTTTGGATEITMHVEPIAGDLVFDVLGRFEIATGDVTMVRSSEVMLRGRRRPTSSAGGHVWTEVAGRATTEARLAAGYLVNMFAAGIVAAVGVITGSSILVVGGMAISPDLLPIAATSVGLVERRWRLAGRALRTLIAGLVVSAMAACFVTAFLLLLNRIPDDLLLADTTLGPSITKLGPGSMAVALAAGMAGVLAFERVGGAAVGVAISVTTTPAVAYVGATIALGRDNPMRGALLVLVTNVVLIIVASTATMEFQRRRRTRRQTRDTPMG